MVKEMIDIELRNFLLTVLGESWTVQQAWNEQNKPDPRVWFNRSGQDLDLLLDNQNGIATTTFNVELVSDDLDIVQDAADLIKQQIRNFAPEGVLMSSWRDHNDDWEAISLGDGDENKNLADLEIEIIHRI